MDNAKEYIIEYYKALIQGQIANINNQSRAIIDYGLMLARTSTILNGGALAILPTVYIRSDLPSITVTNIVQYSGMFFLVGLLFSALSGFVIFKNWSENLNNSIRELDASKASISILFGDEEYKINTNKYIEKINSVINDNDYKIEKSYLYGNLWGFISYGNFFIGCVIAASQIS